MNQREAIEHILWRIDRLERLARGLHPDFELPDSPERRWHNIQRLVGCHFGFSAHELGARRRPQRLAYARQVAMALALEFMPLSAKELAALVGRDRSTITYAARAVRDRAETDARSRAEYDDLRGRLLDLLNHHT